MMYPRAFGGGDAGRLAYLNATGRKRVRLTDFTKPPNVPSGSRKAAIKSTLVSKSKPKGKGKAKSKGKPASKSKSNLEKEQSISTAAPEPTAGAETLWVAGRKQHRIATAAAAAAVATTTTATVAATATATAAPSHARSRARHPVVTKLDGWRITHNQDGFGVEEFLTHWTARSGNLQAEWRTKDELVNDYEGDVKDKDAMRLAALQLPRVHSE